MTSPKVSKEPEPIEGPPQGLAFQVARHQVWVSGEKGAWRVAVDGAPCPGEFATVAEAWAVGVREADRLDRLAR